MGAKLSGSSGGKFAIGQNAEINVTPFVDVMLVLLIIFMVAAPLATTAVKVDLPPPGPPSGETKPPVFVDVEPGGRVFITGREVRLADLNGDLARALSSPRPTEERVMIRASRGVKYAEFMNVMNTLQGGGFTKVGLISEAL